MSQDLRELTDCFKEQIDELMLLEKRADERAADLSKTAKDCILSQKAETNRTLLRIESASDTVKRIDEATQQLTEYLHFCATHVKLTLFLFFGSIILAVCVGLGTYFWYQHVAGEVEEARLELAQADAKLNHKPIFLPAGSSVSGTQGDYVRVVPNTEARMSHANGEPYPGVYAEVWTKSTGANRDWLGE